MRSLRAERDSPGNQGQPTAARAVAAACAANPVALLNLYYHVVHEDGSPGGYRWGRGHQSHGQEGTRGLAWR